MLEHRFGLSHQTFGRWLGRYAKRNVLTLVFGVVMFCGLYWVIWLAATGGGWPPPAAFFVVSVMFGQLMPVLILPLFYKIERIDNPELTERMAGWPQGTGLSIEGVYRMGLSDETAKANAMLAGLGRTRRVLMGDTLLDQFTRDEIEVIFAHEIGHHVFRHIRKMIVSRRALQHAGFWICDQLLLAWARSQYGPLDAHRPAARHAAAADARADACSRCCSSRCKTSISRHYERQCDRYALERTGLTRGLRLGLSQAGALNKDDPDPHPLEVFLFHSHPPISERLAMAED